MLVNFGFLFVFIPVVPDLIDTFKRDYAHLPESFMADASSTLFNIAYSIGLSIGPLVGGYLTQFRGFEFTSSTIGLTLIAFTIFQGVFGGGLTVKKLKEDVQIQEESGTVPLLEEKI